MRIGMKALAMTVLMSAMACSPSALAPTPAPSPTPSLRATALVATLSVARERYVDPASVEVEVVLVNRGAAAVDLPVQVLESAPLFLRVRDGDGKDVASGPPPTPRPETTTIAPGQRLARRLRLDVFSPPLPPGAYSTTVRAAEIESNTVRFQVGP